MILVMYSDYDNEDIDGDGKLETIVGGNDVKILKHDGQFYRLGDDNQYHKFSF